MKDQTIGGPSTRSFAEPISPQNQALLQEYTGPKFEVLGSPPEISDEELLRKTRETQKSFRKFIFWAGTLIPSSFVFASIWALDYFGFLFPFYVSTIAWAPWVQDTALFLVWLSATFVFSRIARIVSNMYWVTPSYVRLATLTLGSSENVKGPRTFIKPFNLEVIDEVIDMRTYTLRVAANFLATRDGILVNLNVNVWVRVSKKHPGRSVFEVGNFWQNMLSVIEVSTPKFVKLYMYEDLKGREMDESGKPITEDEIEEQHKKYNQKFLEIAQNLASQYGGTIENIDFSDVQLADPSMAKLLASPKIMALIAEGRVRSAKRLPEVFDEIVKVANKLGYKDEAARAFATNIFKVQRLAEAKGLGLFVSGDMFGLGQELEEEKFHSEEEESDSSTN